MAAYSNFLIIFFIFLTQSPFANGKTEPTTTPIPTSSSTLLSLPLHPYASVFKPENMSYSELVVSRLVGSKARSNSLNYKLKLALSKLDNSSDVSRTDFQQLNLEAPVEAVTGEGEYVARIGVGSPVMDFHLILDTGSDITWFQCLPCISCSQQSEPMYDPSKSSSYGCLSCASQQCNWLGQNYSCLNGTCPYEVLYGDNSYSSGELATENLSFSNTGSVNQVAIGCSHLVEGDFGGAAGILGLGGTDIGLPSQVKAPLFSYCLVEFNSNSSSSLEFNSIPPDDTIFVPLIINPKTKIFYYVELTAVVIDEEQISIPPSVYRIDESGKGGIILDSGTTVTMFPAQVYSAIRDTFAKHAENLPSLGPFQDLDTCYNLTSVKNSSFIPRMAIHFSGGAAVPLRPENYLLPVDTEGRSCFAFTGSSQPMSIVGNIQQQGMRISYDLVNLLVGFSPRKC